MLASPIARNKLVVSTLNVRKTLDAGQEDSNVEALKLRIELIPKPLWELNLRSSGGLGKSRWDKLRSGLINEKGAVCAVCGSAERLHGHEVWGYREKKTVGTAVLLRVEIVCIDCHDVHHWARTTQLFARGIITGDRYTHLRRHFRRVNGCRQQVFDDHFLQSLQEWDRRSKKKWLVDWGEFQSMVDAASAAREAWAARNVRRVLDDDPFNVGPSHHIPDRCPECGTTGTLSPVDADTEAMTEGQEADYEQGLWGFAYCRACQSNVFWQA